VPIPLRGVAGGPVQLWDVATGRKIGQFMEDDERFLAHGHSKDGRYLVVVVDGARPKTQRIRWLDIQEMREWEVEARIGAIRSGHFSPACDFAALRLSDDTGEGWALVETSTARVIDRFETHDDPSERRGPFEAFTP